MPVFLVRSLGPTHTADGSLHHRGGRIIDVCIVMLVSSSPCMQQAVARAMTRFEV
jgi:hypothetical protein